MEDIDITKPRKRFLYYTGIIGMLLSFYFSYSLLFIVYLLLYLVTRHDKPKQKGVLNLPYQKFVFVFGNLALLFLAVMLIISTIFPNIPFFNPLFFLA